MRVDDAISPSLIMSSTGLASIPKREPACPRTETSPLRLLPKQKSAPVTTQLMPSLSPSHCSTNASAGSAAIAASNGIRSEEHTSELQSLMRISYAVFCLKKKKQQTPQPLEPPSPSTHTLNNQTK